MTNRRAPRPPSTGGAFVAERLERRTLLSAGGAARPAVVARPAAASTGVALGGLDPGFGTGGLAGHDVGFTSTTGVAVDGSQSVIVGPIGAAAAESFGVTRYQADGSLDATFGSGGVASVAFAGADAVPAAVAVLGGGRILVAGTATTYAADGVTVTGSQFAVAELLPSGLPNLAFGAGGLALIGFGSASEVDTLRAIAIAPSGVIYLGGRSDAAGKGNADLAITALTARGRLDRAFATTGRSLIDVAGGDDTIQGLAVQRDGAVVAVGSATVDGVVEVALARVGASGTPDPRFGTGGLVTDEVGGLYDAAESVAIQPQGQIVVGGLTATGTAAAPSSDFLVQRYTSSGQLDPTFGGTGTVVTSFAQPAAVTQVVLQSDGGIIASGRTTPGLSAGSPAGLAVAVARYTAAGVADPAFGGTTTPTPTPTPTITATVVPAQTATVGVAYQFVLGSFTALDAAGPYAVDVNWGDGTADTAFTAATAGAIASQPHTYAAPGTDVVTVTISDAAGDASDVSTFNVTVAVPVAATPTLATAPAPDQAATAGVPMDFDLGSFAANNATAPYTVDVNWGDGTADTTFAMSAPGMITAQAHAYAEAVTETITVTVTDAAGTTSNAATSNVTVSTPSTASLELQSPADQTATVGVTQAFSLGRFMTDGATGPYTVDVDWGDGAADTLFTQPAPGTIAGQLHAFGGSGVFVVTVTVSDAAGHASNAATFAVSVTGSSSASTLTVGSAADQTATVDVAQTFALGVLATEDATPPYTVDVSWGDLTADTTFVVVGDGTIPSQSHTYAVAGTDTVSVTVTDVAGFTSNTAAFQVTVVSPTPTPTPTIAVTAAPDQTATTGASVQFALGSFASDEPAGPYAIDVAWGDGTPDTTFTTTADGAIADRSHAYASAGADVVTVTVTDAAGDASGASSFHVTVANGAAPPRSLVLAPASDQSATVNVATPFDLGSFAANNDVGPYAVDVSWGDGTADATVSVASPGTLPPLTHAYAVAGTDTLSVTITDAAGQTSNTSTLGVTVLPPGAPTGVVVLNLTGVSPSLALARTGRALGVAADDSTDLGAEFDQFTASRQGVVALTAGGDILAAGSSGSVAVEAELVAAGVDLVARLLSTVPASVLGGLKSSATVIVTEAGTETTNGSVTITIGFATDAAGDGATDTKALVERVSLKAGQGKTYKVPFVYPSAASAADYYLLATVTNGTGVPADLNANNNVAASPAPVAVTPAFVALTGSALSVVGALTAGKAVTVSIDITNTGNVTAKGKAAVDFYLSTDDTTADGTHVGTAPLTVGVPAGKSHPAKLRFTLPTSVTPGAYTLLAVVDAARTLGSGDASVGTPVVDATQVDLS